MRNSKIIHRFNLPSIGPPVSAENDARRASFSFAKSASFCLPFSLSLDELVDMKLPADPRREPAGPGPLLEFGRESVKARDTDRKGVTDSREEDELRRRGWLLRDGLRERYRRLFL